MPIQRFSAFDHKPRSKVSPAKEIGERFGIPSPDSLAEILGRGDLSGHNGHRRAPF